jgi:hypothetical protein
VLDPSPSHTDGRYGAGMGLAPFPMENRCRYGTGPIPVNFEYVQDGTVSDEPHSCPGWDGPNTRQVWTWTGWVPLRPATSRSSFGQAQYRSVLVHVGWGRDWVSPNPDEIQLDRFGLVPSQSRMDLYGMGRGVSSPMPVEP